MAEDNYRIAGWEDASSGQWYNVEAGDKRAEQGQRRKRYQRQPSSEDLLNSNRIVVAIKDVDGEWHHLTIYGPISSNYPLDEVIADILRDYDTPPIVGFSFPEFA